MSITPEPPLKTRRGRLKHGSILNGNIRLCRVSSQWKSTPIIASIALAAQIALLAVVFMPILRTGLPLYQSMYGLFFVGICLSACWLDGRAVLSFFGFTVLLELVAYIVLPDVLLAGEGAHVRLLVQLAMFTVAAAALFLLSSTWERLTTLSVPAADG